MFPALLPQVRKALALDLTSAGLVLTTLWLAYAASQFPGGVLGDRLGERTTLVASLLVATGGVVLATTAPGVGAFVAGTVVFGVGTGLYSTIRMTVISDVYSWVAATAIGLSQAIGNVGTATLPVVAGLVAATALGWRWGFGLLAAPFALTVLGLWLTVPRRTRTEPAAPVDGTGPPVLTGILQRGPLLTVGMMLFIALGLLYSETEVLIDTWRTDRFECCPDC